MIFNMRSTWIFDRKERPERSLLGAIDTGAMDTGAMDTACWRRTWFSDSTLLIFSSSLMIELWDYSQQSHPIESGMSDTFDDEIWISHKFFSDVKRRYRKINFWSATQWNYQTFHEKENLHD